MRCIKYIFKFSRVSLILGAALVLLPACGLFEKTNVNPHRPAIFNLQVSPSIISTGDKVTGSFTYYDPGADIETLSMRDRNGSESLSPTPMFPPEDEEEGAGVFLFPGITGTIQWELVVETSQAGLHNILIWVEDSKWSRSNLLQFTINVIL